MKRAVLLLCLLLTLTACGQTMPAKQPARPPAPSPTPTPTPTPEPLLSQTELEQVTAQAGEGWQAMGIQAAVIQDGAVIAQAASGWAVNGQISMTPRHKMRCASLTKIATALTAGVLMDQEIVDLEEDLSDYWGFDVRNPAYPDTPITVDMLLTHTSSLTDASGNLDALKGSCARQRLAGSGYYNAKPGVLSSWSYNNYGFSVLGMTLELAADRVLDDVLGDAILTPMGIDAAFEAGSVADTGLLCALYQGKSMTRSVATQKTYKCVDTPGYRGNFFAGGFTCSAGDMARLAALLAEDGVYQGQQLLSPETVAFLEQPFGQTSGGFYPVPPPAVPGEYVRPGPDLLPHRLVLRLLRPHVLRPGHRGRGGGLYHRGQRR